LPTSDGSADQVIKTNGSGVLSWVDQSGGGGTIQTMPFYNSSGSLDTITITGSSFTFYDSTGTADSIDISTDINLNSLADVSVAAPSLNQVLRYNGTSWVSSDSAGASWSALTSTNTAIRTLVGQNLANTNAYIATKLDSSSYTTADVRSKASLANTNAFIATKTTESTALSRLANTNAYIATKAPTASPTFTGTVTADGVDLGANNPHIRFDDSDTINNGEITLSNTALRIESDGDNAVASSLITFHIDASEKMRIDSSGNVTTAGSITPGGYNTGQVIEELHAVCNTTSLHGRATIQSVTGSQTLAESYGDATGSVVTSYTPPSSTKMIVYEYTAHLRWADAHAISHWRLYYQIDGGSWTEVTNARTNRNGYYPEDKQILRWVFEVNAGSTTAADGIFSAATPTLGFKWQCRDYASVNERGFLHQTTYWDGSGGNQFSKPMIMVKAIA
jgi:hypothetical protein